MYIVFHHKVSNDNNISVNNEFLYHLRIVNKFIHVLWTFGFFINILAHMCSHLNSPASEIKYM